MVHRNSEKNVKCHWETVCLKKLWNSSTHYNYNRCQTDYIYIQLWLFSCIHKHWLIFFCRLWVDSMGWPTPASQTPYVSPGARSRSLRLTDFELLAVLWSKLELMGDGAFAAAAPCPWSSITFPIRLAPSIDSCKSRLKTSFYSLVFESSWCSWLCGSCLHSLVLFICAYK